MVLKTKGTSPSNCSLVQVNEKVILPPYSGTNVTGWLSHKVPNGEYTLNLLDNAPSFSDRPGILIPNSLVTVANDRQVPLTMINTVGEAIKLSPGAVVAYAEQMEQKQLLEVAISSQDEVPELDMTYEPDISNSDVDFLALFNLSHVPESQRKQIELILMKHRTLLQSITAS